MRMVCSTDMRSMVLWDIRSRRIGLAIDRVLQPSQRAMRCKVFSKTLANPGLLGGSAGNSRQRIYPLLFCRAIFTALARVA